MAPSNFPQYNKDEKVLCFHHELLYEAKVLDYKHAIEGDKKSPYQYRVHYKGWKNTWDDWVPQDRIRKMNDDNKVLAANLKLEMDKLLKPKTVAASTKKKAAGSDLSSNRGSEERYATPITGRGQKRGRDYEIEKVGDEFSSAFGPSSSILHGLDGNFSDPEGEDQARLRRSKRLRASPARSAKELLAPHSKSTRATTPTRATPCLPTPPISPPKSTQFAPFKPSVTQSAAGSSTVVSNIKLVTSKQMNRSWAASYHATSSLAFDWAGLRSDILYEDLNEEERKAGTPPPGWTSANKKPKPPPRRLPPIICLKCFPRNMLHLYQTKRRSLGEETVSWEENFNLRPAVRIYVPDHLKALLVDDWENVTKNMSLVPLPSEHPVNEILTTYFDEEKHKRRLGSAEADLMEEVVAGCKEYFEKCVGRILLYRFERQQYHEVRKLWEEGKGEWEGKNAGDVYGAEHLCRLFVSLPELIAQTNMDYQSVSKLRDEIAKLTQWLGKNSNRFFTAEYEPATQEYIEKSKGSS